MSKFTEGPGNDLLQFTANNERAVQTLKPSSAQKKNALREFLVICIYFYKNLLENLPTGFPASSNHCRCTVAYSAIQPTVLGFQRPKKKKNQKIMILTAENKTYYMWLFRSRHFRKTKETKVIQPQEKSLRLKLQWPTGDMLQIKKLQQIK